MKYDALIDTAELRALRERIRTATTYGEWGAALLEAKAKVPHGQWLAWQAANIPRRLRGRNGRRWARLMNPKPQQRRSAKAAYEQALAIGRAWAQASVEARKIFCLNTMGEIAAVALAMQEEKG